jgi:hypothetical protein
MAPSSKLLRLPASGRLLVVADLHGNLRDFLAVAAMFERLFETAVSSEVFLLFLGDLLHGPYLPRGQWQSSEKDLPFLHGRPYRDQSPAVLLGVSELMMRHPRRVFTLLGNHEHAHIGGPRTSLFARDEAVALEQRLGVEASLWLAAFLKGLPLWALAPCGVLFSHAAPAAELNRLEDLEAIDYRRYLPPGATPSKESLRSRGDKPTEPAARLLGQLLWGSSLSPQKAQEVLLRAGAHVAVYGHAVVPGGYQTIGNEQLILSTSFGMDDARKRVLLLDLSTSYRAADALRPGIEILPLYPSLSPSLSPQEAGDPLARLPPSR